jgi:hypothetical protein
MGEGIVPEFDDETMAFERGLNGRALNAASTAVDQAHFLEARGGGGFDVLVDDGDDVCRSKRVKVQLALDGNPDRSITHGVLGVPLNQPRTWPSLPS